MNAHIVNEKSLKRIKDLLEVLTLIPKNRGLIRRIKKELKI